MKPSAYFPISCFILFLAFASCQKVIKVNLNNAASQYVIEANVTDQPGPYTVTITKSVNFDQDNTYPTVSGATVVITDNTANVTDTLKEVTPGNYNTSVLTGVSGHKYSLYINTASNTFTSSSTMPSAVPLDSLYTQLSPFGSRREVVPVYTDPVAKGNNYHFVEVKNDSVLSAIYIRNDNLVNGRQISEPLNGSDGGSPVLPGDVVVVYLECIDSAVYQYFYGLQQSGNANSASPANPVSNIAGGCLGYFSAHTSSAKSVVVQ